MRVVGRAVRLRGWVGLFTLMVRLMKVILRLFVMRGGVVRFTLMVTLTMGIGRLGSDMVWVL